MVPSFNFSQFYFGHVSLSGLTNLILSIVILLVIIEIVFTILGFLGLFDKDYVLVEINLSKIKSMEVNEEHLSSVILNLLKVSKIYSGDHRVSLEVVKTNNLVKLYAYVPKLHVEAFKNIIRSHFPGSTFKLSEDYLPLNSDEYDVLSFSPAFNEPNNLDRFKIITELLYRNISEVAAYQVIIQPDQKFVISSLIRLVNIILNVFKAFSSKQVPVNEPRSSLLTHRDLHVSIRLLAHKGDTELRAALGSFKKDKFSTYLSSNYRFKQYKRRLSLISFSSKLNTSNMPSTFSLNTIALDSAKQAYKALPLAQELTARPDSDITIGSNLFEDKERTIGLTDDERQRHLFIVGGTGSGKSNMLGNLIEQDISSGKGLALIDPHGDLAEAVIKTIPKSRIKDVIYFEASDISHPIGLNILEIDKSLKGDDLLLAQDFVTESVVSILRKLFSDNESGGHRLEHVLRNAVQTALTQDNPNLFTVYRLLTDNPYRFSVIAELKDKTLKSFWVNEYMKAGDMQRVKLSIGVTSKLGRFLRSTSTRRILGQAHSTINFDEIINSSKILICNFSKGKIGEDTSALLGSSVLTQLQLAAYKRQNIEYGSRTSFYLYVDEFQNFASSSFSQILSEARKYKLFLTLAEQSVSQQEDTKLLSTLLSNIGTLICFRCASPIDEDILLPIFRPNLSAGDLLKLPAYTFYGRINAVKSYEPFSGETTLSKGKLDNSRQVILFSRNKYGFKS
jgi:hypothetical protein